MWYEFLVVTESQNSQACLADVICINDTFVAVYAVIFTIVISLGVYIYGLQNRDEKITLLHSTDIKGIIRECIFFFAFTFLALPSPYEVINYLFAAWTLLRLNDAFDKVFEFNESELSGEKEVKKFKDGVIKRKLTDFAELTKKNEVLNEEFEKKDKQIERFMLNESNNPYHLIHAQRSGYITDIDLNLLFSNEDSNDSYYVPYSISCGAPVDFDTVILGIKKSENNNPDDRLRSFVSISDKYENPISYIEAETRSYYPQMISLIKLEDAKSLELKLKEFSGFVDRFTRNPDSFANIIQFINDDIIFPLQKYVFKRGDIDCIKKVVSFSIGYIYQGLERRSIKIFNIFFRNFGNAFYDAFNLDAKRKNDFFSIYLRWLDEIVRYSLKSKIKNGGDYLDFAFTFLSGVNEWLKIAFDHKDIDIFKKTLKFVDDSLSREVYEYDKSIELDEVIFTKKAVLFGFTAWVHKTFSERKNEVFYREAVSELLLVLTKNPLRDRAPDQDNLNYFISLYLKTAELLEHKVLFEWGHWDMLDNVSYRVTIREDIKNLLADRILGIVSADPLLIVNIKDKNYNDELSLVNQGDHQFNILLNKTKDSFVSTEKLTDEQFEKAKNKFYEVFLKITEKHKSDVNNRLILQPIDDGKFNEFVKHNFEAYRKSRVLFSFQKFIKGRAKKVGGFGYDNTLLFKEQFVKETNVHYTNSDQFGENLARSEDNMLLELIYKKVHSISAIDKKEIKRVISPGNNAEAIVFWLNDYFSIEMNFSDNFVPYWKEIDSRKDRGPYYQGSISGIPVFIIYKFQDKKLYPDSMFVFQPDSFSVHEYEIEKDTKIDNVNTKWASDEESCLALSVTNLSGFNDVSEKILNNWIINESTGVHDKSQKIEELQTKVMFKLHKGLDFEDLTINEGKIKIFSIESHFNNYD